MDNRNPYEILQVFTRAEPEVIEAAYKRLAQKYHPDRNPSPDANERMQNINWAYDILRDPEKRKQYDRASQKTRSETQQPPPPPPKPKQEQQTRPAATHRPSADDFDSARSATSKPASTSNTLRNLVIVVGILVVVYVYFVSNQQEPIPTTEPTITLSSQTSGSNPAIANYDNCIPWSETNNYDGQFVCVIGKIVDVTYDYDEPSKASVWTADFSLDPSHTFSLVGVDRDLTKWNGKCVVVYGKLFDRDLIRDYVENPQPSMIDADPLDEEGFDIVQVAEEICR